MNSRLILYVVALVVIPTAILSITAGLAVRDRERNLEERLQATADRLIRTASETLMTRFVALQDELLKKMATAVDDPVPGAMLAAAERLRRLNPAVDRIYVFRLPDAFLYPPQEMSWPPSEPAAVTDFSLLDAAKSMFEQGRFEDAVREYENALVTAGGRPAVQAEAALGAGMCYRRLSQFKFAAGSFRQLAGYSAGAVEAARWTDDSPAMARNAAGYLYNLSAMKELVGVYMEAAEREAPASRERWQRLAAESELELLDRVVLLYDRIVPAQREELVAALRIQGSSEKPAGLSSGSENNPKEEQAPPGAGQATDSPVVKSSHLAAVDAGGQAGRRSARLLSLLREREWNLGFAPAERAALAETIGGEVRRNGIPSRMIWLIADGVPYSLGASAGSSDFVGGFRINPAALRRYVEEFAGAMGAEHGLVITAELGDKARAVVPGVRPEDHWPRSGSLGWPFDGIVLEAYPAEPDALIRNRTLRLRLQGWGILVLALGIIAGAWAVLRHNADEMRRLRERSDYVAGISHDLRTPLSSMRMLAESLYLGRVEDAGKQEQFLGTIVSESKRLGNLVERVLYFFRFGENALAYQLRKSDIGAVVKEAVESFAGGLAGGAGSNVRLEVEPDLPPVMADPSAISQVVLNLVDNAVKYSKVQNSERRATHASSRGAKRARDYAGQASDEQRETSNEQRLPRGRIEVKVRRGQDRWVEISVSDEGPGIAPGDRKKIFRKFYRAGTDRGAAPGIGLGLALCHHIVKGHGGRIEVESELGKGSMFTVRLPPAAGAEECGL